MSFWPVFIIVYYPVPLKHKQNLFIIVSNYTHKEQKKNLPRAQTTRLASFGPVIIVVAFHLPLRTVIISVVAINIIYYKKTRIFLKNLLTNGPNDARRIVWARYRHSHVVCASYHRRSPSIQLEY